LFCSTACFFPPFLLCGVGGRRDDHG
jgi:hypothetical protein